MRSVVWGAVLGREIAMKKQKQTKKKITTKKIAEIEKRLLCLEIMYGALCSKSFRSRKK